MSGPGRVLVVNAGSSSVKLRVLDGQDRLLASRDLETAAGAAPDEKELARFLSEAGSLEAVGHRVVHGGNLFSKPVLLDATVIERLESLADLAPLHQSTALAAARNLGRLLPNVPEFACFDTAFHASLPAAAAVYALPRDLRQRFGLRRFGFHGLSHSYASRRCAELLDRPLEQLRIVTCHLGSGASLAAVAAGRSVDTTMGFTPLEGLVMATRSGSVDPGLLLWLIDRKGIAASELLETLERASGLLGLCGKSDMREVLAAARTGDSDASLALDAYIHRLRASIASMATAMGGLDALVFTGGVGENSSEVRRLAAEGLAFLGVRIESVANEATGDRDISQAEAPVRTVVVAAREDLEIAREVRLVLSGKEASAAD
ncbi:MAG TPA: acetate/propionate family kinase [Thermoanaerobaculia bacterium]|nr:acetate/propionate family kinase [Thermoanaerobaculia bacterium]